MRKIIFGLMVGVISLFGTSVSVERSHYDYNEKFQDETSSKLLLVGRAGKSTIVGSAEEISRFGFKDKQVGVESYTPLLHKDDRLYVNALFLIAPSNEFLSNYEYGVNVYKGIFKDTEIGAGYKEMNFMTSTVRLTKVMLSTDLIYGIRLGETITHNLGDQTTSYDTSFDFNNEKDIKIKYTYGFGKSMENFGALGIKEVKRYTNLIQFKYRIIESTELGLSYVHEIYEPIYTKDGGTISLSYNW